MPKQNLHKQNTTLGWDVGGAHLKAALVDADGRAVEVIQVACPLWRGLNELHHAIDAVMARLKLDPGQHAVTMTGELADIFPDRNAGVMQIAGIMAERLGSNTHFYAGSAGLVVMADVGQHLAAIASANWLASAAFVAMQVESGLFVDIGSTTADFVLLGDGVALNRGFSDAERMQYEELVYTGVVRTPLMALATHVPFAGEWQNLAAEHFATTADVYRLTGDLDEAEDMSDTADGTGKTMEESARRIARMIGRDLVDAPNAAWIGLAGNFKQMQINQLKNAAMRCFSRNLIDRKAPIIGAGAGSFLARELARQLDREYCDVATLVAGQTEFARHWAGVCLPAYAVARLGSTITGARVAS